MLLCTALENKSTLENCQMAILCNPCLAARQAPDHGSAIIWGKEGWPGLASWGSNVRSGLRPPILEGGDERLYHLGIEFAAGTLDDAADGHAGRHATAATGERFIGIGYSQDVRLQGNFLVSSGFSLAGFRIRE